MTAAIQGKPVHYSILDRIEIHKTLDRAFGEDAHAKKIRNLVIDYFGYSPLPTSKPERFTLFMEGCQSIILAGNKNIPSDANAAVILQTNFDENGAFSDTTFFLQLQELTKTNYVVFRLFESSISFGETIRKIAKELVGRSIKTLIVRTHGNAQSIELGFNHFYRVKDVKSSDFDPLHPRASIIFDGCDVGLDLAKKIAMNTRSKSVFAYTGEVANSLLTFCCEKHGYGAIGFDNSKKMLSMRFQLDNDRIAEVIPCSATTEGIEKVKKTMFTNTMQIAEVGEPGAQCNLAFACYIGEGIDQSYKNAVLWYRKAAEQGHAKAQNNLACVYCAGQGIAQSYKKAVFWRRKAAEQGHAEAQCNLGWAYYTGEGIAQSYKNAVLWYRKAAEQGHAVAQYNLACAYAKGEGVTQSFEKAVLWYQKAAEQGHSKAQYNLACAYAKGEGVTQSSKKAVLWYRKAAEQGHVEAKYHLRILYKKRKFSIL